MIRTKNGSSFLNVATAIFILVCAAMSGRSQTPAATPSFSPSAGSYTSSQTVTISDSTSGSTIYYTTDGSTPTSSSAVYSGPITLSTSETLSAIATAPGDVASGVQSAMYTFGGVTAPTFVQQCNAYQAWGTSLSCTLSGVGAGHTLLIGFFGYNTLTSVTSTVGTPASVISDGNGTDAYILSNAASGTITITGNSGTSNKMWVSVVEYANVTASPLDVSAAVDCSDYCTYLSTGNFNTTAGSDVLWSFCSGPGGTTLTPGTDPLTWNGLTSPSGSGAGVLVEDGIAGAAGTYYGQCNGDQIGSIVTVALKGGGEPAAATPMFSPAGGIYSSTQTVTISTTTPSATIYYTTDGTTPTTSSTVYSSPVTVGSSETLNAIATADGDTMSAVGSAIYSVTSAPTFVQQCNGFQAWGSTLSCTLTGVGAGHALLIGFYGPNTLTSVTSSAGTPTSVISDGYGSNAYILSNTASGNITITGTMSGTGTMWLSVAEYANVAASPLDASDAGNCSDYCSYLITNNFNTTSGSDMLWSFCSGPGGITLAPGTDPITWIGLTNPSGSGAAVFVEDGLAGAAGSYYGQCNGDEITNIITVALKGSGGPTAVTPTYSPAAGTYSSAQTVTISTTTPSATIYYTTDGTTPTTSSAVYSSPITVSASETLNAIAAASGYAPSPVGAAYFSITPTGSTGSLSVYLSPPGAQATTVPGALTETFDALAAGVYTTQYVPTVGIGTYTGGSANPFTVLPPDVYGGAIDSNSTVPTNYLSVAPQSGSTGTVNLTLAHPATYFGLWCSAVDANRGIKLYSGGILYATVAMTDVLTALNGGNGSITAINGSQYQASSYFGNPNITSGSNASNEPFVYLNFALTDGATIDSISFYNTSPASGFESDNHSVIFAGNSVSIPTTYVPVESFSFGSQVAQPVFTPAAGSYSASQSVTFSTTTSGASIRYTTDGTTPSSTNGALYTGAVTVSATETIRAIAYETGMTDSPVASATYTIVPISVTVSPSSSDLGQGGTQQFTATVTGSSNTAVNWTISPTGIGTISSSGLYTAPSSITTQRTVTITATSQADSTKSASATIALLPPCGNLAYSYTRTIVVDHTKVPNTDQPNFPLLVTVTDPSLRSVANGGHVNSSTGYDITFSADSAGATTLNYEIESYNPSTGTLVAWVGLPNVSHSTDTVLFMAYGNPSITTDQSDKTAVWDSNYLEVLHLDESSGTTVFDSTTNGNNGSKVLQASPLATSTGEIGGAQYFNGTSDYITLPASMTAGHSQFSVSFWVQTVDGRGNPTYWNEPQFVGDSTGGNASADFGVTSNSGSLSMWSGLSSNDDSLITATTMSNNVWHRIDAVNNGATIALYFDGGNTGQTLPSGQGLDGYGWYLGAQHSQNGGAAFLHEGSIDEFRFSQSVRSSDWIATEYNNQSSPSTFYRLFPENAIGVTPSAVALYASQTQGFAAIPFGACTNAIAWSVSPVGAGSITPSGQYTSPSNIVSQQTVTIVATSQSGAVNPGVANVILLPPSAQSDLTLSPSAPSPYSVGSTQSFVAKLTDLVGVPQAGVAIIFTGTGANAGVKQAVTNANGVATYTYAGTNNGTDNIQASAALNGQPLSSNVITATWITSVTPSGNPSLTISPVGSYPTLGLTGLCGAFTDSTGAVIEPLSIGTMQKVLIVPSGATQLQLGINDDNFSDNFGSGFVVDVNGVPFTIGPTAMPWIWVPGGLNGNYHYGVRNGSGPIIAAANLIAGHGVVVTYESGTVSAGGSFPLVNADGFSGEPTTNIPGSTLAGFVTQYMYDLTREVGQSIQFTATLMDGSGNPITNAAVTFSVSGANAQQFSTTTDALGDAIFSYVGQLAGSDIVQAQATPAGGSALVSQSTTLIWIPSTNSVPTATDQLTPASVAPAPSGGQLLLTNLVRDSSGNPLPGVGVTVTISGADNEELDGVTDSSGQVRFLYQNQNAGNSTLLAVALVGGTAIYSNEVDTSWTATGSGGSSGSGGVINISIQANSTVTLPNALQLNANVSDSSLPGGSSPTLIWSQLNGPGTATFVNPAQSSTTATFDSPGNYFLQLAASDGTNSASAQIEVSVNSSVGTQGWIGSPSYGSTLTGIVPITVAAGVTLTSGRLVYSSASDFYATNPVVLNGNVTGSGQIGTFDTTLLANGSYYIQLQATDSTGHSQYSIALVTVAGQYKPGRVTSSVTDLVVPATGLAIQIQRQYDSLNASTSGDFGYGWSLGTRVDLAVDPSYNVTFTLGGQRKTFYFTPQSSFFLGTVASYTPEPGLAGSLTTEEDISKCPFDMVVPDGSLWLCRTGELYSPIAYIYTDPTGTQYTISASGSLQSIKDLDGNTLTVTPSGIFSSVSPSLSVQFARDPATGRITQITDPQGNIYQYGYDACGNLAQVTYPNTSRPSTYTYVDTPVPSVPTQCPTVPNPSQAHFYLSGTDFRGNSLPTSAYYTSIDTDPNGLPLNGRLKSVTDGLNETTSYAYDLNTNTTTITYPPDGNNSVGAVTMVYDSYGMPLSSTDPLAPGASPTGHTIINTYNSNHNLTSVTDQLGHTTSYTYDALGNRTSVTYPANGSSSTTSSTVYNQFSEPTSSTDELGNIRTYIYDANYNPLKVTDMVGGLPATVASFAFNANGTMQAGAIGFDISTPPGNLCVCASHFTYDAAGNLASKTDALGRMTSYVYNNLGQKTSMVEPYSSGTSPSSATTTYTYDPFGHLTQISAPLGRTTSSSYDANGNKLSDTDAVGNVTNYSYDALNRLVTTTYPNGKTVTNNTYDFRGNIIKQTDQGGNVTQNQYDLAGRLTSVTKASGTTSYAYYNDGRKQTETDPAGHITTYTYDAAGNLTGIAGVNGNYTYAYDPARNRKSTDANTHTTQYQYDSRNRLTKTIYADGNTVINTYDGPGNLASVTDQAGNVVNYAYDAANQLLTVKQYSSPGSPLNTNYLYDPLGNLSSSSDARGNTTINGYDLLSELKTKTLPDSTSIENRTYDFAGNLKTVTHFNGAQTTYTYDVLNRLSSRTTQGTTVGFTYTATGKRQTMTDASGTTTYTYDSSDRLSTKATPAGTLSYTYDAAGNVASIASSNVNGAFMSYTWNLLNQLYKVVDNRLPSGADTTTYVYLASNLVKVTYPNGLVSTLAYDPVNRLTSLVTVTGSSSPVASYNYAPLGATGIKTQAAEAFATSSGADTRNLTWSYDNTYRLNQEQIANDSIGNSGTGNNGTVSYTLDPVGNRTQTSSSITGISSTPPINFDSDDLMQMPAGIESYDANGNTTGTGSRSFAYDSENHLVSMGSGAVTILYDGDGNRVAKTVGGATTNYLVDDLNPTGYAQVIEEVTGGTVQREYTYGLQRISENQPISGAWTPSIYGYDGGSSVRQLTNLSGAVTDTYTYDAFGNLLNSTGTTPNIYKYRGEQYDPDLGLYYLRARYMNPLTGRFMSRDPDDGITTDPKTLHKYLYADGDPVDGIDPSGRATIALPLPAPPQAPPSATSSGAGVEYALLVGEISLGAVAGIEHFAKEVNCVLETAGSLLQGVTTDLGTPIISITFEPAECSVRVKRDCNKRHQQEQDYCSAEYGDYPNLLSKCQERAMWRWNNCLRGLPDPGPLDPLDPNWSPD